MKNNKTRILIIILIIIILVAGVVMAYKIIKDKNDLSKEVSDNQDDDILTAGVDDKDIKIFNGKDRPIAVMIDNHNQAWPQARIK